jgi:hypothetical protein
MAEILNKRDLE